MFFAKNLDKNEMIVKIHKRCMNGSMIDNHCKNLFKYLKISDDVVMKALLK